MCDLGVGQNHDALGTTYLEGWKVKLHGVRGSRCSDFFKLTPFPEPIPRVCSFTLMAPHLDRSQQHRPQHSMILTARHIRQHQTTLKSSMTTRTARLRPNRVSARTASPPTHVFPAAALPGILPKDVADHDDGLLHHIVHLGVEGTKQRGFSAASNESNRTVPMGTGPAQKSPRFQGNPQGHRACGRVRVESP